MPGIFLLILIAGVAAKEAAAECTEKRLRFSADYLRALPGPEEATVWGGNATEGQQVLSPPFSRAFLERLRAARAAGIESFAYLEGPCGDTGGVDDGERERCTRLHREFNRRFSPGTPDTPLARWKPFTLQQMKLAGELGIGYCEIDNLDNNVTVPLLPLLREIKGLYDSGRIGCRLVLKNVALEDLDAIKRHLAPTPAESAFIAPFHIFEANNTRQKRSLDAAMVRLKGRGAVTIISTDTNHYGEAFTDDRFLSCRE